MLKSRTTLCIWRPYIGQAGPHSVSQICMHLANAVVFFLIDVYSCEMFQLAQSDDLDNDIDELLQEFESRCQRTILHTLLFY